MRTTIDSGGRVVIPKDLRERLGLAGGRDVEVREVDGRIEIVPHETPMTLKAEPGGEVAVPDEPLPVLTDELVRATLERVRR
jgi:AbrB family looped-hinge helix DNA binding protein